jgi:N-methylhydantoinase A
VVSALGGLVADVKNDFIRSLFIMADAADAPKLKREAKALLAQGSAWLRDEQGFAGEASPAWFADMHYRGQSFEIEVPLGRSAVESADMAAIAEAFHRAHEGIYDFCDRDSAVQVMNLRLVMSGTSPKPYLRPLAEAGKAPLQPSQTLSVFFDDAWHEVPLYRRMALRAGHRFAGPCVVAQDDTTTCIPPGFAARVDGMGNIILELAE